MDTLLQDLRYAFRQMLKNPGFAAAVVFTLVLGIGANSTIFSVVSALLFRPLPVEEPERIVRLHAAVRNPEDGSTDYRSWSYPDFVEYAARADIFAGLAAHERRNFHLDYDNEVVQTPGLAVTGSYFDVLGVRPLLGRMLLPSDDAVSDPAYVAVISRGLWKRRFGSDPGIVGAHIAIEGHPFTVVGVVGSESVFRPFDEPEVWIPMSTRAAMQPDVNPIDTRNVTFIGHVFGRLQPGVSVEQAQTAADAVGRRLAAAYPETNANRFAVVTSAETLIGLAQGIEVGHTMRRIAWLLMGVVLIVLLIACANVANLLLVRATMRANELSIRHAMGADRGRVARHLLTESLVLALMGGAGGLLLAVWGLELARRVPEVAAVSPALDWRVISFTLAIAVSTGVSFGLAPILGISPRALAIAVRGSSLGRTRRAGPQRILVAGQIGLALLLLVASGLVLRTLKKLNDVDPGYDPERLLTVSVSPSAPNANPFGPAPQAEVRQLVEQLRALPGVADASVSTVVPLSGARIMYDVEVPGYQPEPGEHPIADIATVGDGYLHTVGASLLSGRGFIEIPPGRTDVILINEAMARRYWSGETAVGERITVSGDTFEVVGVVGDMRFVEIGEEAEPMVFFRYPQMAFGWFTLFVRTSGDPDPLLAPVRRLVQSAAPERPVPEVRPMSKMVDDSLAQARVVAAFFTLFGALALVLAAVGLYGVIAYMVARRTREIGIRLALGADSTLVMMQFIRDGGALVGLGSLLGIGVAFAATRLIEGALYGVESLDPLSFTVGTIVIAAAALLASWLPARRAARVDPMVALRAE
ncbi:MAG: ABC transporter permease [Gemmatimonadota bacterium]